MTVFRRSDRDALGAASAAFALIAVVLAFAAVVAVGTRDTGGGVAAPASANVALREFAIEPDTVRAPVGGTIAVTNNGTVVHNLTVKGTSVKTDDFGGGESVVLSLSGLKAGEYTIICSVPGHEGAGMRATLTIGAATGGAAGAKSGSTGKTDAQLRAASAASDATVQKPIDAYVAQVAPIIDEYGRAGRVDPARYKPNTSYGEMTTNPVGGPPLLAPRVLADGTKQFDLTAKVVPWEIEPGRTVSAWTYNGMTPGPTIRVEPGDKVRVRLRNELPQSTSIHFHGIETPNAMDGVAGVTQRPVRPGTTYVYDFTVPNRPAVGMYHSHLYAQTQVPDGLAAAFIVGNLPLQSLTGKAAPDVRIPMMLNDTGSIGLSLNGKSFPATAPIVATVGQWVQIDYMNEGVQAHPMHLHGMPQVVVAKDGYPLAQPYKADTILVAPGERYSVLVQASARFLGTAKDGTPTFGIWAFHCHILTHADREDGMFGMVTTFVVAPPSRG